MLLNMNELFECVLPNALKDAELMAKKFWPGPLEIYRADPKRP